VSSRIGHCFPIQTASILLDEAFTTAEYFQFWLEKHVFDESGDEQNCCINKQGADPAGPWCLAAFSRHHQLSDADSTNHPRLARGIHSSRQWGNM